jgi:hypothetical protein
MTTDTLPTISLDVLATISGGDFQGFLQGTGRVLDTMVHDATVGAVGGAGIGAAAGLIGGPAAPATVAGGAATGGAIGGLGGALFGIGRGIGNEVFGNTPAAAPAR